MTQPPERPALLFFAALGTGGLLTLMTYFNGQLAAAASALFSSLSAHGTGAVAAILMLVAIPAFRRRPAGAPKAPLWAYLGGISGALTVILTSTAVNSALALSGTLALGLAGQMVFGLTADKFGLFGLPRKSPAWKDLAGIALIVAGSLLIIFYGRGA